MDNIPIDISNQPERCTTLPLTKEQAADLKIDQSARFEVVGTVKEVRQCYNDNESYEVTLKDPNVEFSDKQDKVETKNSEDKKDSLATMPKDELKKVIMVKEVKE